MVPLIHSELTFSFLSSKDLSNEFRKVWAGAGSPSDPRSGTVGYSDTIPLDINGGLDFEATIQTLEGIPTDEPSINSRIILLIAHSQHAFKILDVAEKIGFQPDTVWVGPSSWVGRNDPSVELGAKLPGYLGVAPFRNRDEVYMNFMSGFQAWQRSQQKAVWTDLPAFASETVDALIAMAAALTLTPTGQRDGATVVNRLRRLKFDGVSGSVEFSAEGDRKNPNYSIFNAQRRSGTEGLIWSEVGMVGPEADSAMVMFDSVCFVSSGCGFESIPEDTYPEEKVKLPWWVSVVLVVLSIMFLSVAFKYWRSRMSKRLIKAELTAFQDSIVGLRAAEADYVPNLTSKSTDNNSSELKEQSLPSLAVLPPPVVHWCWKETDSQMHQHDASKVYGDPNDCWILYDGEQTKLLEAAYSKKIKECSPLTGYSVDIEKMIQRKVSTGFERDVLRVVENETSDSSSSEQNRLFSKVAVGDVLPSDLKNEPQMVLVEGDMVQVSKQRKDGWAFGTKLHHTDEEAARLFVKVAADQLGSGDVDEANVFPDTGWFPLSSTRTPSAEELQNLKKKVDSGALDPPEHWAPVQDKSVAQRHLLSEGNQECDSVVKSFLSTLRGRNIQIVKVERIQNLAMFQSYIVKRQTICYRETVNQDAADPSTQQKALKRFERRWLWHGTNSEVVDKILNQGFNRSFCGKNATAYGKGVYFARDASYSSHPMYSVPDAQGNQYMMACSVCVGEFCQGKHDALTPDVRDPRSHSLYDSTVNSMTNPSIYVTYHDAQAYPEYLITFRQA